MIKETLEFIETRLLRSRYQIASNSPTEIVFFNDVSGEQATIAKPAPAEFMTTTDLASFYRMLPTGARIYVSAENVTAKLSADGRDESCLMLQLRPNALLADLKTLGRGVHDHGDLVEWLRTKPGADATITPPTLLARIRHLTFGHSNNGTSGQSHGDEELSRRIRHEVSGTDEIPERFDIRFQMYPELGVAVWTTVTVNLIVDPEMEVFRLVLEPNAISKAVDEGSRGVRLAISEGAAGHDVVMGSLAYKQA